MMSTDEDTAIPNLKGNAALIPDAGKVRIGKSGRTMAIVASFTLCLCVSHLRANPAHDKQILRSHGGEESETSSRVQLEHTGYLK